jgi:hypothetical protein
MRFSTACSLSFALASAAFATEPAPDLDIVLEHMASSAGVEVAFRERKELALLSMPLESEGVLYFSRPDRFARFTLEPAFASLVVNGRQVSVREGRDGEPIDLSSNPLTRVFVENFVVLWSGDREKLEALYDIEFSGDPERWNLRLVPRRTPLADAIVAITMTGDAGAMREMLVEEKDGDRTSTTFEGLRSDRAFTPQELDRIFTAGQPLERLER